MPVEPRVRQPVADVLRSRSLTIPALAFAIGEKPRKVRHIVYGYVYPSHDVMVKIASYLSLPIADLFSKKMRDRAVVSEAKKVAVES